MWGMLMGFAAQMDWKGVPMALKIEQEPVSWETEIEHADV